MRLHEIQQRRQANKGAIPQVIRQDASDDLSGEFQLDPGDGLRERMRGIVGPVYLRAQQRRLRRLTQLDILPEALLCLEERFGDATGRAHLFKQIANENVDRVMVPGCYLGGRDVQLWLRRGARHVCGIDANNFARKWSDAIPKLQRRFHADVKFMQAPLEDLPLPDQSFDLIYSTAVLEHIQNIRAASNEMARVLRAGGWAWHSFGPLYFTYGGDHCINEYGFDSGYDHLRLEDSEYRQRIDNEEFFETRSDPHAAFWARRDQFSFATLGEYLEEFKRKFDVSQLIIKVSQDGIDFRDRNPDKWRQMLMEGLQARDLLIKGVVVTLRKRT